MQVDLLLIHAGELLTLIGPRRARVGRELREPAVISDGAIAVRKGRIVAVGTTPLIRQDYRARRVLDARGACVTPGLVDAHTHLIFAGTREHEFELRIQGVPYMEIARTGGGINATVERTRKASKSELVKLSRQRLRQMLAHGTTTAEVKSGYGLNLESEIKILRVVKMLDRSEDIDLVPTFLGAHDIPREYADKRADYVRLLVDEMVPDVASKRLARFCDVFCEVGAFSVEESREILQAAKAYGLKVKLHAEEFRAHGGAELAAELGAVSADHLMAVSDRGIRALKQAGVIAVLLPGTSFFLGGERYAPARRMIEEGVAVALGSDFNPGSCMTFNMQLILTLACTQLKMIPAEALIAATVNAAYAIGMGEEVGTLQPGKKADFVVWAVPSYQAVPYHFGVNLTSTVVKAGKIIS